MWKALILRPIRAFLYLRCLLSGDSTKDLLNNGLNHPYV